MREPVVLITGANGEIGHGLIEHCRSYGGRHVVALDLKPIDEDLARRCFATIVGDILDADLLQRLVTEYEIHEIFHLAALLSTRSEYSPVQAHRVNVDGTLNLLQLAHEQSRWHGNTVKFLFPSSIAAYGLPSRAVKDSTGPVAEEDFNQPATMYGCNKLYCEHLGRYYSQHFQQLARESAPSGVDFRAIRFPGLISASTLPSGGTSDYGPEMLHAAAARKPYACFVDPEACLPFMAMPDAVKALTELAAAPAAALRQRVYNIGAFSLSAAEIRERVVAAFPFADITFQRDEARGRIVDSWPGDVDDSAARRDWKWTPEYDVNRAFDEYLIPNVARRYAGGV
jgi:nucleoside-diphosphate-sugar epimerase